MNPAFVRYSSSLRRTLVLPVLYSSFVKREKSNVKNIFVTLHSLLTAHYSSFVKREKSNVKIKMLHFTHYSPLTTHHSPNY